MRSKSLIFIVMLGLVSMAASQSSCAPEPTSSDIQRERQETMVAEGVAQTGMPAIVNFRELKLAKELYELRDQANLATYSYVENLSPAVVHGITARGGKLTFICDSIGFPLPYAVQFSAPESMQKWIVPGAVGGERRYGVEKLPQAEPNGLFSPGSAEASWILCKDPSGKDVFPSYSEPRLFVSLFKYPFD